MPLNNKQTNLKNEIQLIFREVINEFPEHQQIREKSRSLLSTSPLQQHVWYRTRGKEDLATLTYKISDKTSELKDLFDELLKDGIDTDELNLLLEEFKSLPIVNNLGFYIPAVEGSYIREQDEKPYDEIMIDYQLNIHGYNIYSQSVYDLYQRGLAFKSGDRTGFPVVGVSAETLNFLNTATTANVNPYIIGQYVDRAHQEAKIYALIAQCSNKPTINIPDFECCSDQTLEKLSELYNKTPLNANTVAQFDRAITEAKQECLAHRPDYEWLTKWLKKLVKELLNNEYLNDAFPSSYDQGQDQKKLIMDVLKTGYTFSKDTTKTFTQANTVLRPILMKRVKAVWNDDAFRAYQASLHANVTALYDKKNDILKSSNNMARGSVVMFSGTQTEDVNMGFLKAAEAFLRDPTNPIQKMIFVGHACKLDESLKAKQAKRATYSRVEACIESMNADAQQDKNEDILVNGLKDRIINWAACFEIGLSIPKQLHDNEQGSNMKISHQ